MMNIRFWGVRGSIATSGPQTAQVGGNTSCVEVRCGDELIILDAGTGLRGLGAELATRRGGNSRATILLSHFHWDHIQGFPFFAPAYVPGWRIALWGDAPQGDVRGAFAAQMRAPHFPVGLDVMRAELSFHAARAGGELQVGAATVRTAPACHPNGCLAWRIDHQGRSLVYATDTEHHDGGRLDEHLCELARGADVLIYDAQYTAAEYAGTCGNGGRRGWGHSTPEEGAKLARAAGVGELILFHHDPSHDDWQVARIEAETRALFPSVRAAREGLSVALEPRGEQAAA